MAKCYDNFSREELIELLNKQDKELSIKKYGLTWDSEKEPEQVVLDCENNLPILQRVADKEIKTDDSDYNLLIEGDNYHALTVLNYTHKEKIDVIYIDPPYNTGNKDDFKYNDYYVDKEDGYRHSKWLNFMDKRLKLAKTLLKDNGVIYISIGEQELGNLNILCNTIFGSNNFLSIIARISKTASDKGAHFAPSCDYIICYAKNKELIDTSLFYDEVDEDLYTKQDENGYYRDDVAFYQSSLDSMRGCTNQRYFVECPDGSFVIPPGNNKPEVLKDGAFIKPETKNDKVWRWSYETYFKKKHLLVFKETKTSPLLNEEGQKSRYNIYVKSYLEERQKTGKKPRNFLIDKSFLNRRGTDYLKTLELDFPYSKPKELIKHLINILHPSKDAIILDFFAGSGTTAEAVMDLNKDFQVNRKFIACTNNENNICTEVCYPRIKKIINGYKKNGNGDFVNGLRGNLQYFRTDLIPVKKINKVNDSQRQDLTSKAGEMIAIKENCFNQVELNDYYQIFENNAKNKQAVIYFREDLSKFDELINKIGNIKTTLYIFSYGRIDKKIYNYLNDNIAIEDIPEPIIEIYKEINLTLKD